jgi:host factor-I protein
MNIQDSFLNQARRERINLVVRLLDGSDLHGKISAFDNFTIILQNDEREEQYLIYKHAIATLSPGAKQRVRWNQVGGPPKPKPPA